MITLTDDARRELDAFFTSHPDTKRSVRIYLAPGGCSGPMLTMALDDPNDGDMVEVLGETTFCMARELAEKAKSVSVDIGYMGFMLTPEEPVVDPSQYSGGCASCSCSGGCGSH